MKKAKTRLIKRKASSRLNNPYRMVPVFELGEKIGYIELRKVK